MFLLAFLDVMFHCFFGHHADASVKMPLAPEFITPQFVSKEVPMPMPHHIRAEPFYLPDKLNFPYPPYIGDEKVQMVWPKIISQEFNFVLF